MAHLEFVSLAGLPLAVLSTWHIVVLALAILLLFGGSRLPELARGLARGLRIFRDELHGVSKDVEDTLNSPPRPDPQRRVDSKPVETPPEKKQEP